VKNTCHALNAGSLIAKKERGGAVLYAENQFGNKNGLMI
jgi:hypothetical protein